MASEVRKLAERSQTAAAEISRLSIDGVQIAEGAGQLLAKLFPIFRKQRNWFARLRGRVRNRARSHAGQLGHPATRSGDPAEFSGGGGNGVHGRGVVITGRSAAISDQLLQDRESQPAPSPHTRRGTQTRSNSPIRRAPDPKSTSAGLSQMHRAFQGGLTIDMGANNGGADSRDRDFTSYEA